MKKIVFFSWIIIFLTISNQCFTQTEITFYTTKGNFTVKMYDTITPITSGNFISLVNAKFYDKLIFHRVINNFMIQGGCPYGTGYGNPGYFIPDEFDSTLSNIQKTISMANTGSPNSGGSQFFINLVNNINLDYNKPPYTSAHPVFGIVINNFSVVQTIGAVPVNSNNNKPLTDVVMDSLRVTYNPFLGISQNENSNRFIQVYPSPATDKLYFLNPDYKNIIIDIYTISGDLVQTKTINPFKDFLDLKSIKPGIYIGKYLSGYSVRFFRFIKQ